MAALSPLDNAFCLQFNGIDNYMEVPNSSDFSVATTGALTVSAWMRPDVLDFPNAEGSGYVHWMGKGQSGAGGPQHEWVFRIYNLDNSENRPNRISFYVFNLSGGEGIGSYFQDPVAAGEWIHVTGVADSERTYIYKNGVYRKCDQYRGVGDGSCQKYTPDRWIQPQAGTAPVRIGTRDLHSFFQGAIAGVRMWNRALAADEIAALYQAGVVPQDGLIAEYLLNQDVAPDTQGVHNGSIYGATWVSQPQASTLQKPASA